MAHQCQFFLIMLRLVIINQSSLKALKASSLRPRKTSSRYGMCDALTKAKKHPRKIPLPESPLPVSSSPRGEQSKIYKMPTIRSAEPQTEKKNASLTPTAAKI